MWYGESQKLAEAVFSLAHKLQPAIIFIDEIGRSLSDKSESVTSPQFLGVREDIRGYNLFRINCQRIYLHREGMFRETGTPKEK